MAGAHDVWGSPWDPLASDSIKCPFGSKLPHSGCSLFWSHYNFVFLNSCIIRKCTIFSFSAHWLGPRVSLASPPQSRAGPLPRRSWPAQSEFRDICESFVLVGLWLIGFVLTHHFKASAPGHLASCLWVCGEELYSRGKMLSWLSQERGGEGVTARKGVASCKKVHSAMNFSMG